MKEFCFYCKETVDEVNWKSKRVETEDGDVSAWICGKHFKPINPEFIPEAMRAERDSMKRDLIQPFREGQLSKEFVDEYGTDNLEVTDKEVRNAKNVWGDV